MMSQADASARRPLALLLACALALALAQGAAALGLAQGAAKLGLAQGAAALGLPPRLKANTTQLAARYGLRAEQYSVTTEDGYVLALHRLPGRGRPVLLVHPLADSSETWLLRGETSLAVTLARRGLDVWLADVRGNDYSPTHLALDQHRDAERYWDFSFHEHGYYDLPAFIDFVLRRSGHASLNAIGMSQGTAMFFVLGSSRPEYNAKVNAFVALAPVAFLHHMPQPLLSVARSTPVLFPLLRLLRAYEMLGNSRAGAAIKALCRKPVTGYVACALGGLFPLLGWDAEELGPAFHARITRRFPQSTSLKNFEHYVQSTQGRRFAWFDYGPEENVRRYGSTAPPDYALERMTMPVVLLCGKSDKLSLLADVAELRARLPNVVQYAVLERQRMNHIDFVWGKRMDQYLYPYVFDAMDKYF